jgi:tRNA threonylcarbamoyladenosine biosynthesis protein TsaE
VNVEVTIATAADMRVLGRRLAAVLTSGDLVILSGPLGAGKTTLTQGIGDGLGIRGPVTSPTFVIARVHPPLAGALRSGAGSGWRDGRYVGGHPGGHPGGHVSGHVGPRPALVHADAYRLGSALELDDLDLDADTASSVTVVEWGEGLAEGLADDRLEITIVPGPSGDAGLGDLPRGMPADSSGEEPESTPRTVRIRGVGGRWQDIELPPAEVGDRL